MAVKSSSISTKKTIQYFNKCEKLHQYTAELYESLADGTSKTDVISRIEDLIKDLKS